MNGLNTYAQYTVLSEIIISFLDLSLAELIRDAADQGRPDFSRSILSYRFFTYFRGTLSGNTSVMKEKLELVR
jgi:hypothetical protein